MEAKRKLKDYFKEIKEREPDEKLDEKIVEAFGLLGEVIAEDPKLTMAYCYRGKIYIVLKDYKRALFKFQLAIKEESKKQGENNECLAEMYLGAAQANFHLQNYEETEQYLKHALKKWENSSFTCEMLQLLGQTKIEKSN